MKRVLSFTGILILLTLSASAQLNTPKFFSDGGLQLHRGASVLPAYGHSAFPKAAGPTDKAYTNLLTQDFSTATFPPTGWTTQIISGPLNWTRGTSLTLSYNTLSSLNCTFGNGYAIANSDGVGSGQAAENCVLKSPAINCTGQSYVWLSFNEFFRQYGSSTGHVEVSNNGTTWTSVYSAETGLIQNASTANPHFVDINVSTWAANQATFYVRFHWTGNYDYYWVVDDITVYARPQYDATLTARTNMYEYSTVPLVHYNAGALPLSATAKNVGGASLTNVNMGVKVYNGDTWTVLSNVTSNTLGTLAANATGTLTATSYTPPAGTGFYVSEYIVHSQQTDADIHNDTIIQALWINDSIYARDDAIFTGTLEGSLGLTAQAGIFGQNYQVNVTDRLTHVACYVTGAQTGDQTQIVVYSTTNGLPVTQIGASALHTFTSTAAQWVDLPISGGPLQLSPGTYFIGIRQISTAHNLGVAYTLNNYTANKVYAKIGTDPWDTLNALGYNIAFVIRPYMVCGSYKPVITAPQNYICMPGTLTLTSSPGSAYAWSSGGPTTQSFNVTMGGTYHVTVTSLVGCTGISNPFVVTPFNKPGVNLGNDTTVCGGLMLNAGSGFASYSWTGGSSSNQYLWAGNTGLYSVTVTNSDGCANFSDINVTVNPYPNVNLGPDLVICANQAVTLNAGGPYTTYLWTPGGQSTQQIQVDSTGTGPGTKTIIVNVTNNGCPDADTIRITFDPCTGLQEAEHFVAEISPNPASEFIRLSVNAPFNGDVSVLDFCGRVVMHCRLDILPGQVHQLNLQNLRSGMYFLKFGNEERPMKFMIR